MKAILEGKIENVEVTKDNIILGLNLGGRDGQGAAASGGLKLVVRNNLSNGKIQVGRIIKITVDDGEES